ncbi:hypothetical protein NIES2135_54300 [Leptolyngbya boryana NIES-2135]|uniref:Uncharacterized protein n=2 Tax=Leptolyngbya group TaxID=3081713 RepID=A0A1Z4JPH0_LEPBY|nr:MULTISPECIES: DUF6262 family protein [Leptolyngbya]MBD2370767.1 hypothetical protein [Leptolyngbya sp. FACHB-161]MBD2401523.1 hypothetical protein [Leptolyngbya sp. FACHB-239]MBD2408075.1 hypothetical protein [Leptolyngbya sp. FACHB-402]BAY58557.1 hypothetical protein NIES2135_54300 [Leptolyngbya boryana NIES-2135]
MPERLDPKIVDRAFQFIEQKPGLFPSRLRVLLGLKLVRNRTRKSGYRYSSLLWIIIKLLQSQGKIEVVKDPLHDEPLLYTRGTAPPPKPLFQPSRRQEPDCKVFKVPLDQLYLYTKPEPMTTPTQATQKTIDQIGSAIAELQLLGQPFTVARVLEVARVHSSFLKRYPEVKQDVEIAVRQSGTELKREKTDSVSDLDEAEALDEVEQLRQTISELEERNRELRQQLSGEGVDLVAVISNQKSQVEAQLKSLQAEAEVLSNQLSKAKQKLAALDQILSILPQTQNAEPVITQR